jgi:hypothetical protein
LPTSTSFIFFKGRLSRCMSVLPVVFQAALSTWLWRV